jgi:hypothetical protein
VDLVVELTSESAVERGSESGIIWDLVVAIATAWLSATTIAMCMPMWVSAICIHSARGWPAWNLACLRFWVCIVLCLPPDLRKALYLLADRPPTDIDIKELGFSSLRLLTVL